MWVSRPRIRNSPINAARVLDRDDDVKYWGRTKTVAGKTQFSNSVETGAEETETLWPFMLPTIIPRTENEKLKTGEGQKNINISLTTV